MQTWSKGTQRWPFDLQNRNKIYQCGTKRINISLTKATPKEQTARRSGRDQNACNQRDPTCVRPVGSTPAPYYNYILHHYYTILLYNTLHHTIHYYNSTMRILYQVPGQACSRHFKFNRGPLTLSTGRPLRETSKPTDQLEGYPIHYGQQAGFMTVCNLWPVKAQAVLDD